MKQCEKSSATTSRSEILAVAMHFLIESERAERKSTPGFSEDAVTFLTSRDWDARDLAVRMADAVASNRGSLITAADLVTRLPVDATPRLRLMLSNSAVRLACRRGEPQENSPPATRPLS